MTTAAAGTRGGLSWLAGRWVSAALLLLNAGCSLSSTERPEHLQLEDGAGQLGPPVSLALCPPRIEQDLFQRVCIIDSQGAIVAAGGNLPAVALAPPYGVYFQFHPGVQTAALNPGAAQAFAAPYDVNSSTCCAEDNPANQIPARVEFTPSPGLLVTITDAVPAGYQIAVAIDYDVLYGHLTNAGFLVRFYVGHPPP